MKLRAVVAAAAFGAASLGGIPPAAAAPTGCTAVGLGKTDPATCSYVAAGDADPYAGLGSGSFILSWTAGDGSARTGAGTLPKNGSLRAKPGTTVTVTLTPGTVGTFVIGTAPTNVGTTPVEPVPAFTSRTGAVSRPSTLYGLPNVCFEVCAVARITEPSFRVGGVHVTVTPATVFTVADPNGGDPITADWVTAVWGTVRVDGVEILDATTPSGRRLIASAVHNDGGPATAMAYPFAATKTDAQIDGNGRVVNTYSATLHDFRFIPPFDGFLLGFTAPATTTFLLDITCEEDPLSNGAALVMRYRDAAGDAVDFDFGRRTLSNVVPPNYSAMASAVAAAGPYAGRTFGATLHANPDVPLCAAATTLTGQLQLY